MGLSPFRNCSGFIGNQYVSVNPNPKKFEIVRLLEFENTYAEIRYPGCTTFEGLKVMVFQGHVAEDISRAKELDPHFDATKFSPIARFAPTREGRRLAMIIAGTEI